MNSFGPPVAQLLFHGVAGKSKPWLVKKGVALVRAGQPYHDRSAISHLAKSFLAFLEPGFGLLTLSNILDNGQETFRPTGRITNQRLAHRCPDNGAVTTL